MVNSSIEADLPCHAGASDGASFERDTVTWTFAKLAERNARQLFQGAGERHRYSSWIEGEARRVIRTIWCARPISRSAAQRAGSCAAPATRHT